MNAILMTYVVNGQVLDSEVEPCPGKPPVPTISENYGTLTCPVDPVSGLAVPGNAWGLEFVVERHSQEYGWQEYYRAIGTQANSYVDMPSLLEPGDYRIRSRFVSQNRLAASLFSAPLEVNVPEPPPEE